MKQKNYRLIIILKKRQSTLQSSGSQPGDWDLFGGWNDPFTRVN